MTCVNIEKLDSLTRQAARASGKKGRYGAEIQHKGSFKISKKHAPFQQSLDTYIFF